MISDPFVCEAPDVNIQALFLFHLPTVRVVDGRSRYIPLCSSFDNLVQG
jgi:hypothetical protein